MKKNKIILTFIALSALILIVLIFVGVKHYTSKGHQPTVSGPTIDQQKQVTEVDTSLKKQSIEGSDSKPQQPTTTPPPSESTTANLSLAAQQETNGSVTVLTKLYKISSGTCNLIIKNGTKQETRSANIIYQSEYSTCAGFSIPTSSLGSGNWDITLNVTSNAQTYSKNIMFEVK